MHVYVVYIAFYKDLDTIYNSIHELKKSTNAEHFYAYIRKAHHKYPRSIFSPMGLGNPSYFSSDDDDDSDYVCYKVTILSNRNLTDIKSIRQLSGDIYITTTYRDKDCPCEVCECYLPYENRPVVEFDCNNPYCQHTCQYKCDCTCHELHFKHPQHDMLKLSLDELREALK